MANLPIVFFCCIFVAIPNVATTHKIRLGLLDLIIKEQIMEPKTKVRWVDEKRVYVETPQGDDFIVGFPDESLYAAKNKPLGFKWTNLWHPFLTSIMKEMQVLSWEKSTGRC